MAVRRTIAGLLLALAFLALVELPLRLIPLERWEPEFAGSRSFPLFVKGSGIPGGRWSTNPHFKGSLNAQSFAVNKAPGVLRVFVLGGSAAYGYPLTEEFGFTGYLRRALAAALPGGYEIVNVAGMSYGSHRVLDILAEVLTHEPDLVVVYSGNNEYIERNLLPRPRDSKPEINRVRDLFRHLQIYRLLRLGILRARPGLLAGPVGEDITDLRARPVSRGQAERSAENDREILVNYQNNLEAMARILNERQVKGVFCTVPVNLTGWPPDRTPVPALATTQARRWDTAIRAAESALLGDDTPVALEQARAALALAPEHAYTAYIAAKAEFLGGERQRARELFLLARDRDPRVLRALSTYNTVIRGLAGDRIAVADLEAELERRSPGGLPGTDFFVDYVHPTREGHRIIAKTLLPFVATTSASPGVLAEAVRLIKEDTTQVTDPRLIAFERYAQAMTLQQSGSMREAAALYREVLNVSPTGEAYMNLASILYRESGDLRDAKALLEQGLALEPGNGPLIMDYATLLFIAGEYSRAAEYFRKALGLNPLYAAANACLGHIALQAGRPREAVAEFETAVAKGHETADLYRDWSEAARRLGLAREAAQYAERARELEAGAPAPSAPFGIALPEAR